jgi:hypothetical protein
LFEGDLHGVVQVAFLFYNSLFTITNTEGAKALVRAAFFNPSLKAGVTEQPITFGL